MSIANFEMGSKSPKQWNMGQNEGFRAWMDKFRWKILVEIQQTISDEIQVEPIIYKMAQYKRLLFDIFLKKTFPENCSLESKSDKK